MTPMRLFTVAFWLFVGTMLAWQAYDYNAKLIAEGRLHSAEQHFFYTAGPTPVAPQKDGPDVRQTGFAYSKETPPGYFTCQVSLQNFGNAKAVGIQILVRPFRGGLIGDDDNGGEGTPRPDNDPLAQMGQWLAIPDLGPGEKTTQTITFINQADQNPGTNRDPIIQFQAEKPKPAAPSPEMRP